MDGFCFGSIGLLLPVGSCGLRVVVSLNSLRAVSRVTLAPSIPEGLPGRPAEIPSPAPGGPYCHLPGWQVWPHLGGGLGSGQDSHLILSLLCSCVWSPEVLFCALQDLGKPAWGLQYLVPFSSPSTGFCGSHHFLCPLTPQIPGDIFQALQRSAPGQHPAGVWCGRPLLVGIHVCTSDSPRGLPSASFGGREHSVSWMAALAAPPQRPRAIPPLLRGPRWWMPGKRGLWVAVQWGAGWPCLSPVSPHGIVGAPSHREVPFGTLLFTHHVCLSFTSTLPPCPGYLLSLPLPDPVLDTGRCRHIFRADDQELRPDSSPW